jgi:hypothetical protein
MKRSFTLHILDFLLFFTGADPVGIKLSIVLKVYYLVPVSRFLNVLFGFKNLFSIPYLLLDADALIFCYLAHFLKT